MVDSSPMYGAAEAVVRELLQRTRRRGQFAATKVWTDLEAAGVAQLKASQRRWGIPLDLVRVHSLRDWRVHLRPEGLEIGAAHPLRRHHHLARPHAHDELARALAGSWPLRTRPLSRWRSGRDVTASFPELVEAVAALRERL